MALKHLLSKSLWLLLGRRNLARLGRFLSNEARLDGANDPATNGEYALQGEVLRASRDRQPLCVLDVGANVGAWTRAFVGAAAQAQTQVRVHAFEPTPATFRTLEQNLAAWGCTAVVQAHRQALASRIEERTFYSLGANQGRNSLHAPAGAEGLERHTLQTNTVDAFCRSESIERIHFLKIDAEGHDLEVIEGSREMLAEHRIDAVQFEYNHCWIDARRFLKDAFDFFAPLGYRMGKVTPKGVEVYPKWDWELESFREGNYLAFSPRQLNGLTTIPWWNA